MSWDEKHTGFVTGTSNPSWKNLVEKSQNASSAYQRQEWSYIFSANANYTWQWGNPGDSSWGRTSGQQAQSLLDSSAILHTTDLSVQDLALLRLKRKLSTATGSANMLPPLVEIGDLHRTIKGSVEVMTTLLKTLIDIKRTRGRSAYRYVSKAWLTWNFGMQPLISDTKSLLHAIDEYKHRSDNSVRLSGSASTNGQYTFNKGASYDYLEFPSIVSWTLSYRYVGAFDLFLESANDYSIWNHLGLDFASVPSAAWELMAYSWALDYFANIGTYLEDLWSSPPGTLKYLVCDRRYQAHFITVAKPKLPAPTFVVRLTQKPGEAHYFDFERTLLSVLPHIGLRYKTQDEIGKNSLSKLSNLFAIVGKSPETYSNFIRTPYSLRNTAVGRFAG
jgi:hypothetical protein